MQKAIRTLLFIWISTSAVAQTNVEKFQKFNKAKDTAAINKLFSEWEKNSATDNHFFHQT